MRKLKKGWQYLITAMSIALVLFQLYTACFGMMDDLIQRGIHLGFLLPMCFIMKPVLKGKTLEKVPFYDVIFAVVSCAACIYALATYKTYVYNALKWYSWIDKFFAIALVFLIIEASRRAVGLTFPIMSVALILYALFGKSIRGYWGHNGFTVRYIFQNYYHTTNGVWGQMVGISATMLAMFVIFGSLLAKTGGAQTFIKMGENLTRKSTGGPGKVTVIASALFGMVSGSAMANVAATGTFTIPMMKKAGYSNEWASGISAASSTGGQIMPPMMGTAAFVMAQLIGVPYLTIAKCGAFPAILYYLGLFVAVHCYSLRRGINGLGERHHIDWHEYVIIFAPLVLFVVMMLFSYTVVLSAFYATVLGVLVCAIIYVILERNAAFAARRTGRLCFDIARDSGRDLISMAALMAGAQIPITLINMTGIGVKLSSVIVNLGSGHLFLSLLLSMVVCIILGMGMPPAAAYVLAAAVLAPALTTLGLPILVSHLFIFYFAQLGTVTPPVCAAVYVSSSIAESNWLRSGFLGTFMVLPGLIVPFTFAYNQGLMLEGNLPNILISCVTALIGVVFIGFSCGGYTNKSIRAVFRILMCAGGILLVWPSVLYSIIGLAICAISFVFSFDFRGNRPLPET